MRVTQEEYFQQKLDQEENKRLRPLCSFKDFLRRGGVEGLFR